LDSIFLDKRLPILLSSRAGRAGTNEKINQ
jgi:hypothetical protein